MIEAFVITLREGVEAALVVCLALAYLRKIGRPELGRAVWAGVAVAALLSVGAAAAIRITDFDPEGRAEGIVLLASCAMVTWLVVWMWRQGKRLRRQTEQRLGELAAGPRLGIFLFTFLMVLREGVETVLMLLAVHFTTESVVSAFAAVSGLAVAVALGVAFYKGTLRVDVRKFFAITSILLLIFAFQLLASGIHEFAEAGDLGAGEAYMRVVGPLMKHSALFIIAVLVLPFVLLLRRAAASNGPVSNPAEARKERARSQGERLAKASFAALAIVAILTLGASYLYTSRGLELSPPEMLEAKPEVAVPVAAMADGKLHRFGVKVGGKLLRFLVLKTGDDRYGTGMDACTICNDWGYVQLGERILCRNCVAEINAPTLGEGGGCNPIPLAHERRGETLVFKLEAIAAHASFFKTGARFVVRCPECRMGFDVEEAGGRLPDGTYYCKMPGCEKKLRGK